MEKLLIFGTGFISDSLIEYVQSNYKKTKIIIIYNFHKITGNAGENIIQYSINDDVKKILLFEKPTHIVCLKGMSFVSSNIDPVTSINNNVLVTLNFLENIFLSGYMEKLKKVLIIGSASEYGKFYSEPIQENYQLHPTSLYGLGKIFLYNSALFYKDRGMPIVYVRQFNTVGPNQRDQFALPAFAKQIAKIEKGVQEKTISVGDLTQERDFLDVRDTVAAYILLLEKGVIGEVYNVASGRCISMQNVLNLFIMNTSMAISDIKMVENKELFSEKNSLSKRLWGDVTKIRSLGFKPIYKLEETILDILNYWRLNV